MHVLGHSFSQRRQTGKPCDLHIRKISCPVDSLSASSLSSSAMSSASMSMTSISAPSPAASSYLSPPNSAASSRGARSSRCHPGIDPLALHPTFQTALPPPRLCDRRLLLTSPERSRFDETSFFIDDEEGEEEEEEESPEVEVKAQEPSDYFGAFQMVPKRLQLPPSRWSESTVANVESSALSDGDDTIHGSEEDEALDDVDEVIGHYYLQPSSTPLDGHRSMPNISHKRETLPKRPPIKTLDSLQDFIKRGGWKRRGIVFNQEELECDNEDAIHLF